MIRVPRNCVAIIPIFDPETWGVEHASAPNAKERIKTWGGYEEVAITARPVELFKPDGEKERADQGIIKYVGSEVTGLYVGEYVLFSGFSGTLLNMEGEGRLIIMQERFVIATIPDTDSITVPTLYFRGRDGYFAATFEQALNEIARAFTDQRLTIPVKSHKSKPEDYDGTHAHRW